MKDTVIGIVGAGEVADHHLPALKEMEKTDGVRVIKIADIDRRALDDVARRYGIPERTEDYREIIGDERIGTVFLLTPHHLHRSMTVEALQAGKHVICEKPMATSVADCDAMIAAAEGSRRRLLVIHALRADRFYHSASARIREGRIGRPVLASFRWFTDETRRLEDPDHWKGTPGESGGGVLIDGGCHVADLGNALFGRPARVNAFGRRSVIERDDRAEDTAAFTVEYSSGAIATFALGFTVGIPFRRTHFAAGMFVEIYGTSAYIEGGYLVREDDARKWCTERREGDPEPRDVALPDPPPIGHQLLRSIIRDDPPPVTSIDARNAVSVVEAAYRAIRDGRTQSVDWR